MHLFYFIGFLLYAEWRLGLDTINMTCVQTFISCILPPEPSLYPSLYPTWNPTLSPTWNPTLSPTLSPTASPTLEPVFYLLLSPTINPTTISPTTISPTTNPSFKPTTTTRKPSFKPSTTKKPTTRPSIRPTHNISEDCRVAWQHPFLSTSLWNTPIGTGAIYYPAGIFIDHGKPSSIFSDTAYFVKTTAADPLTQWWRQTSWSKTADHCLIDPAAVSSSILFPANFVQTIYGNNVGTVLSPDGETAVQMLQLFRCKPNSPVFASIKGTTNIFTSNGTYGAHGGSNLSGIGGTIRPGELLPNSPDIAHNLNLQIYALYYYYKSVDIQGKIVPGSCFVWPANKCDGDGAGYGGTNPYLKMGALLAVPPQVAKTIRIQTIPGKKILYALTYYGGYIKDSQNLNWATMALDKDAEDEFLAYYGYSFMVPSTTSNQAARQFYNDIVQIFQSLSVVVNNGPNSVGGGGARLLPLAKPFC